MRTRSRSLVRVTAGLALGLTALVNIGAARQTAPAPTDTLAALLSEVHALRLAMERSAAVGPRVQLALARLNIEEQRTTQLAAQLERARRELADATRESQKTSADLEEIEKALQTRTDEHERKAMEHELTSLKRRLTQQAAFEQQLRSREIEAAQLLSTEQARWIELNSRLDELERLLGPVR